MYHKPTYNLFSEIAFIDSCKYQSLTLKETKSAIMNIFRFFFIFIFKSFVKVELSNVFTINLFNIAENCTEK